MTAIILQWQNIVCRMLMCLFMLWLHTLLKMSLKINSKKSLTLYMVTALDFLT